jgi:hypothetical protein
MPQISNEEIIEDLGQNIDSVDSHQPFSSELPVDLTINEDVIKYKKEVEKISYLLKEKNIIINKLLITLSNQTQVIKWFINQL